MTDIQLKLSVARPFVYNRTTEVTKKDAMMTCNFQDLITHE